MKILVTGGAGFIGSNIARRLQKDGHSVTIIDSLTTGKESNILDIKNHVEFIHDDICNTDAIMKACKGQDAVFHEAALPSVQRSVEEPFESNRSNITGTLSVLDAAVKNGVKKIVYAASSSAYGERGKDFKSEDMLPQPLSPYAVNKLTGEYYLQAYAAIHEIETVALRYFNVFGPYQNPDSMYSAVIPLFIKAFYHKKSPVIYGDGLQSRDFTHISNVVDANILALHTPGLKGEVINIACAQRTTVLDIAEKIQDIMNCRHIPIKFAEPRKGEIRHSLADISKAEKLLGYTPGMSLEDGLKDTVNWLSGLWGEQ